MKISLCIYSLFLLTRFSKGANEKPTEIVFKTNEMDSPILLHLSSSNESEQLLWLIYSNNTVEIKDGKSRNILEFDPFNFILKTPLDLWSKNHIRIASFDDNLSFHDSPQWKLYFFDDFQGERRGWSRNDVSSCGTSSNLFLGGHCNFANTIVTVSYTHLTLPTIYSV
eukprot:TRINITY_DN1386_c0_g1_i1.p1 TRINITY_DN1386_c0_g1~~TRINITY_DN1386_c0_g1_i1.p1  ORF type:complete len:168 (-),score=3.79 TRINITY_DN1386_c0_g1_i1:35-538(-)